MQRLREGIRAFRRSRRDLRLVLVLLLVLNPLLAMIPTTAAAQTGPRGQSTGAMPCHTMAADALDASLSERQAQCPHCSGHAPPSSCHCYGQTATPGLLTAPLVVRRGFGTLRQRSIVRVDAMPMPHREALYRPPKHA